MSKINIKKKNNKKDKKSIRFQDEVADETTRSQTSQNEGNKKAEENEPNISKGKLNFTIIDISNNL